jgi:hypothetical protein
MAKSLPFRIEYRLRLNAGPAAQRAQRLQQRNDKVSISFCLSLISLLIIV